MKTTKNLLIALGAVTLISLTGNAYAQYEATGADGITASPKHRQFLNEGKRMAVTTAMATDSPSQVGYQATGADGITASPKHRQFLAERANVGSSLPSSSYAVGYTPTGSDGITASPKLRQMLNERPASFQIAPVK